MKIALTRRQPIAYRTLFTAITALLLILLSTSSYAKTLSDFDAKFDVQIMGMNVGQAKHRFRCEQNNCILKTQAKPSGLGALMSSDSSSETIRFQQDDNFLKWLSYDKVGISKKNGETVKKFRSLKREGQQVHAFKNQRLKKSWKAPDKVYDAMSFAYAIQFAVLNKQPIENIYLQDTGFQDLLSLVSKNNNANLALDFSEDSFSAYKYVFNSKHSKISLWLLPTFNYFPSKIQIINHNDKKITLYLAEPPRLYETQW